MGPNEDKSALVMSGGGAFGAFQVGAMEHIRAHEPSQDYELYAGISIGAINCALLAQYTAFAEGVAPLLDLWQGIRSHRDVWRWTIWGYLRALCATGIYNPAPLRETIEKNLNIDMLNASGKTLMLGGSDMLNGRFGAFVKSATVPLPPEDKQLLVNWLMASSAFPGAFPAVPLEGGLYVDGGLTNATPATNAVEQGYGHIDVLLTGPMDNINPTTADKVTNVISLLPRVLETLFRTVWVEDLRSAYLLNLLRTERGSAPATIMVYAPTSPLQFDPLGFDPADIQAMITMGRDTQAITLEAYLFPNGQPWSAS